MKKHWPLLVIGSFLILTVIGVLLSLYQSRTHTPYGSSSLSYSHIGHRAVVELMRKQNFDFTINKRRNPEPRKNEGLAIFCPGTSGTTPRASSSKSEPSSVSWKQRLRDFSPRMIVLPKWTGMRDPVNKRWIRAKQLIPTDRVERVLPPDPGWEIQRTDTGQNNNVQDVIQSYTIRSTTSGQSMNVQAASLQTFSKQVPGIVLWRSQNRPVVVHDREQDRYWVSDPDLLNNRFLGKAQNAAFATGLFQKLFPSRTVLVDEYHRGIRVHENLLSMLFTFPGIVLTLTLSFLILCFYWSLYNRWSQKQKEEREERSRVEQADTVGRLTYAHGDHARATQQYVTSVRSAMIRVLDLPSSTGWNEIADRLDQIQPEVSRRIRNIHSRLQQVEDRPSEANRLLDLTQQVNWIFNQVHHGIRQRPEEQAAQGNQ